jgi:hypothetical protein
MKIDDGTRAGNFLCVGLELISGVVCVPTVISPRLNLVGSATE